MTQRIPIGLSIMWSAPSFLFLLFTHFANGQGNEKEIKVLNIFIRGFCTLVTNLQKVEFEETLGGMVEAMTEIQGRADSMMEEIKAREVGEQLFGSMQTLSPIFSYQIQLFVGQLLVQELLRELGRELEQTVGQVEGVQQMLARMELEKMGLQVGEKLVVVMVT